jgi:hypothetical protein
MKIEFVKESRINSDAFWYTQVDGKYVNKSLSYKYETAYAMYQRIVENKGESTKLEILESVDLAKS